MNDTLMNRAEALSDRAAQAAYTAAHARHAGMLADAEIWEARAARLDSMAHDYRVKGGK